MNARPRPRVVVRRVAFPRRSPLLFVPRMTAAEQPFLDAIAAAPDDDAPRLIFADWLDERGDDDSRGRAEFLRVQCALAATSADDDAWYELDARATLLRRRFSDALTEPLRRFGLPTDDASFERGLIARASLDADELVEQGDELSRACPGLHAVRVPGRLPFWPRDVHGESPRFARLLATPAIERLDGLDFRACGLRDAGVAALASAPRLARLKRLDLRENRLTSAGVAALATSESLRSLVALAVGGDDHFAIGLDPLLESGLRRRLERLTVHGLLDPFASQRLLATEFPRLERLALRDVELTDAAADAWRRFDALRGCSLSRVRWTRSALERLAANESLARCEDWNLAGNGFDAAAIATLLRGPALAGVRRLDLSNNWEGLPTLAEALSNSDRLPRLRTLGLDGTSLSEAGVVRLAAAPTDALRELRLSSNGITARGARAIARSESLANLRVLDLSGNPFGDDGARALAAAASKLTRLTRLDVSRVGLTDAGAAALAASRSLRVRGLLIAGDDALTDAGRAALRSSPNFDAVDC